VKLSMAVLCGNEPGLSKALQPSRFISCKKKNCISGRASGIVSISTITVLISTALSPFTSARTATTVLPFIICHCILDGIGRQPRTAIMLRCQDGTTIPSIFIVYEAEICIQHHLMSIKAGISANVTPLPLVLASISTHGQFRNPTFGQQ